MDRTKRFILVLVIIVIVLGFFSYRSSEKRKDLIFSEELSQVAVTVDDVDLTLYDMAFYVAYQEKEVQEEAVIYNDEKPHKYWNAHTNGWFVRSVAEQAVVDMAVHDEIFYRLALAEEIVLDEREEAYLANEVYDFCSDLTEKQFASLGVSAEDIEIAMRKIAIANKYQSILSQVKGLEYAEYDYMGSAYEDLLAEHEVMVNENVWDRISVGSITVND